MTVWKLTYRDDKPLYYNNLEEAMKAVQGLGGIRPIQFTILSDGRSPINFICQVSKDGSYNSAFLTVATGSWEVRDERGVIHGIFEKLEDAMECMITGAYLHDPNAISVNVPKNSQYFAYTTGQRKWTVARL